MGDADADAEKEEEKGGKPGKFGKLLLLLLFPPANFGNNNCC